MASSLWSNIKGKIPAGAGGSQADIDKNKADIATLKTEQATIKSDLGDLGNEVNSNSGEITVLKRNQQAIEDGLKDLKPFKYVGDYQAGTSYKTNDLVSEQNSLYLSKVDNNTAAVTDTNNWLLIDQPINLQGLMTEAEVRAITNPIDQKADANAANIAILEADAAKKNEENTFTASQTITKNSSALVVKNESSNNPTFIQFQNANGLSLGKIGRTEGTNEHIKLTADLADVFVEAANNKSVEIKGGRIAITQLSTTLPFDIDGNVNLKKPTKQQGTPTDPLHIINKQYFDANSVGLNVSNSFRENGKVDFTGNRPADDFCIRFNMDGVQHNGWIELMKVWKGGPKMYMRTKKDSADEIEVAGKFTYTQDLTTNSTLGSRRASIGTNINDTNTRRVVTIDNFNYNNENFTALKFVEGQANKMQFQYNHNSRTLALDGGADHFVINGLTTADITRDNQATSVKWVKDYVAQQGVQTSIHQYLERTVSGDLEEHAIPPQTASVINYDVFNHFFFKFTDDRGIESPLIPIINVMSGRPSVENVVGFAGYDANNNQMALLTFKITYKDSAFIISPNDTYPDSLANGGVVTLYRNSF